MLTVDAVTALLCDIVVYGVIVGAVVLAVANAALWAGPSISDGGGTDDPYDVDHGGSEDCVTYDHLGITEGREAANE